MYIVPLMVAIMMSKWVGDAFVKEGMYPAVTVDMLSQMLRVTLGLLAYCSVPKLLVVSMVYLASSSTPQLNVIHHRLSPQHLGRLCTRLYHKNPLGAVFPWASQVIHICVRLGH